MNVAILRTASARSRGLRRWDNLRFGINRGTIVFGKAYVYPSTLPGLWFTWSFHEHYGGRGGLESKQHRAEIKEKARNLIKHQLASDKP